MSPKEVARIRPTCTTILAVGSWPTFPEGVRERLLVPRRRINNAISHDFAGSSATRHRAKNSFRTITGHNLVTHEPNPTEADRTEPCLFTCSLRTN